jgi:hypothetical protein
MFLVLSLMLAARALSVPGASALGRSTFDTLTNVVGRPDFLVHVIVVRKLNDPLRPAIPLTMVVALFMPQKE